MFQLKEILKENITRFSDLPKSKKGERLEELQKIISSGDWILKEPFLYRGREWDEIFKVKDSTKYERRKTRDTKNRYDYLIHDFTVNCNPEYPDRWQSRFALTKQGDADIFGSETYVILPEKGSKLAYSEIDSYDILVDEPKRKNAYAQGLRSFYKSVDSKEITAAYGNLKHEMSEDIKNLISDLHDVYRGKKVSISKYGCPNKILKFLEGEMEKFDGSGASEKEIFRGLSKLAWIFKFTIKEYFSSFSLGYPPTVDKGAGEVIYQGKYLQIHVELFNYFKERDQT